MLSKSAMMLMGLIQEAPLNAYEITKRLDYMNVRYWYNIADSTVYATLKTLEKKGFIYGEIEKAGNMPDKTVYSLTDSGLDALLESVRGAIISFDYDTNIFSIAAFYINVLEPAEQKTLLEQRIKLLSEYAEGLKKQMLVLRSDGLADYQLANLERLLGIIEAESSGSCKILKAL